MRALAASVALVIVGVAPAAAFDFDRGIGIVDIDAGGRACMDIAGARVSIGETVTVVTLQPPQAAVAAEVVAVSPTACRGDANRRPGDAHYVLRLPSGTADATVALAVRRPPSIFRTVRDLVTADLDVDARRTYFRSCASAEGLHLTVWSDAPLARRRFHADLGYDVEPNCTEGDMRP